MAEQIEIEVAYAAPEKQKILVLAVASDTTVRQAVVASGMDQEFPGLDLANAPVGIFGKKVAKPDAQVVKPGDRIEIYRPLLIDPKQARANRAAKKAKDESQ